MVDTIILIFVLCDELLKALKIKEDSQVKMNNAEIMTVALVAAYFFYGNHEAARNFLREHNYIPNMISKSRFNRRLHAIDETVWMSLFQTLSQVFKELNNDQEYVIDSLTVPVCDNIRISRCRIYKTEEYRGFIASKRRYFYGIRVHLIVSQTGQPIEFCLAPGSFNDLRVAKTFELDLPSGSVIYGDKIYNDYQWEDLLKEAGNIAFKPIRKINSKRPFHPAVEYVQKLVRKQVETSFSKITSKFPKFIHAVTAKGFELKTVLFIISFGVQFL